MFSIRQVGQDVGGTTAGRLMYRTASMVVQARNEVSSTSRREPVVGGVSKRSLDCLVAVLALAALSVLFLAVAGVLLLTQGRPVFYRHTRIGRNGKSFGCLKFRTMVPNPDKVLADILASDPAMAREWSETRKLKNDPRVTRFGAMLRKTSTDELPQLINILRGDMSFVGPRPIVEAETEKYGDRFVDYKLARPGLTGAWQISGRSNMPFERRVDIDTDYVRSWSFRRDIAIMIKTVPAVLMSRGAY